MERCADSDNHVANTFLPQPNRLFEDTKTLDARNHMLNRHPTSCNHLVRSFRFVGQLLATRFFLRLRDGHAFQGQALKTQVLKEFASLWQRIRGHVRNRFVVDASFVGVADKLNSCLIVS